MKSFVARPPSRPSYPHASPHRPKTILTPSTHPTRLPSTTSCTIPPAPATRRTPSPNYFALAVDPESDPTNSCVGPKENWSPPTSSIRSFGTQSPRHVSLDVDTAFDAFRRQVTADGAFSVGHGNLSSVSVTSAPTLTRPRTEEPGGPSSLDVRSQESPASPVEWVGQLSALSHQAGHRPWLSSPSIGADALWPNVGREAHRRAHTLPPALEVEPVMMEACELRDILETAAPHQFLLLDLRVSPQFAQLRIKGALNLCIPTTLLKRPSFTLEKLSCTFQDEVERARFSQWPDCRYIIVYDARSRDGRGAPSAINTIKKFTLEGWHGRAYILSGGIDEFAHAYPHLIERPQSPQKIPLDDVALLAGGCTMPPVQGSANPLFSNIRQNVELISGVGQMDLTRPEVLDFGADAFLPQWLRTAAAPGDRGKMIADKFLRIEQEELARMQKALSVRASSTTLEADSEGRVQIAGFEEGAKNRYSNIWPFEHARVRLQGRPDGACDYVNASHIRTRWSKKRYIASQGPLPATFEDFWSVVWDQDIRVIVMLTAESEGGQLKCHPYWAAKEYGAFRLKALSEKKLFLDRRRHRESASRKDSGRRRANTNVLSSPATSYNEQPFVVIRKLALSHVSEPFSPLREITQLHCSSWPDFGTPAQPSHLLSLVELSNTLQSAALGIDGRENTENARPLLVHCSAGCGRTGTFCTVDSVIDMLKRRRQEQSAGVMPMGVSQGSDSDLVCAGGEGEKDTSDNWIFNDQEDLIQKTVEDFRRQRISMVQGLRQYVLCYESVLEWVSQQQRFGKRERSGSESRAN